MSNRAKTDARGDAEYDALAHKYLQMGLTEKKIADRLVDQGLNRPQATDIARRTVRGNPQTRKQNAYILFAVAVFFIGVFALFMLWPVFIGEPIPIVSPIYVLLLPALWFAYKGYRGLRDL